MGTPLPENPIGSDCVNCWGPGKPFGIEPTPKILTITLFELEEGQFFTETLGQELFLPHQIYQTASPCEWVAVNDQLRWQLTMFGDGTEVLIGDPGFTKLAFFQIGRVACVEFEPNQLVAPSGNITFNGFYIIEWSEIFT